jgi:hypothetical protein
LKGSLSTKLNTISCVMLKGLIRIKGEKARRKL